MDEKDIQWLLEEKYHGQDSPEFQDDCKRLEAGEPLGYIIGHTPFLNTTIHLDSKPLIPRTETEFWVASVLKEITPLVAAKQRVRVLDLCAGSGCIGVAVLTHIPSATVDFVEIDEIHHQTIQKNILENNINIARTSVSGGDLFEHTHESYDYIFTNPPYIDSVLNRTTSSVTSYEPHKALYGGKKGMEIITRIITEAPHHLLDDGLMFLEHEPEQTHEIHALATQAGFIAHTLPDQFQTERFTRFKKIPAAHNYKITL